MFEGWSNWPNPGKCRGQTCKLQEFLSLRKWRWRKKCSSGIQLSSVMQNWRFKLFHSKFLNLIHFGIIIWSLLFCFTLACFTFLIVLLFILYCIHIVIKDLILFLLCLHFLNKDFEFLFLALSAHRLFIKLNALSKIRLNFNRVSWFAHV